MRPVIIEIRLRDAHELRLVWLEDGGVFVPGSFAVGAGSPVLLRVILEEPSTATLLDGTVVWRRLPPKHPAVGTSGITLRAGIGVSFPPSMRARALFLERLARGAAAEARRAFRYPTAICGELSARANEHASPAELLDVAVRGARVAVNDPVFLEIGSAIELRVGLPISGELSRAPLMGRVAWIDRASRQQLGARLDLATTDERLIWAKIVTRAREELEERPIRVERLVG